MKPGSDMAIIRVKRDSIYIAAMLDRVHEAKHKMDDYLGGGTL